VYHRDILSRRKAMLEFYDVKTELFAYNFKGHEFSDINLLPNALVMLSYLGVLVVLHLVGAFFIRELRLCGQCGRVT